MSAEDGSFICHTKYMRAHWVQNLQPFTLKQSVPISSTVP